MDTMAFLILHLIRIAETPACKISAQSLAKVSSYEYWILPTKYKTDTIRKDKYSCGSIFLILIVL